MRPARVRESRTTVKALAVVLRQAQDDPERRRRIVAAAAVALVVLGLAWFFLAPEPGQGIGLAAMGAAVVSPTMVNAVQRLVEGVKQVFTRRVHSASSSRSPSLYARVFRILCEAKEPLTRDEIAARLTSGRSDDSIKVALRVLRHAQLVSSSGRGRQEELHDVTPEARLASKQIAPQLGGLPDRLLRSTRPEFTRLKGRLAPILRAMSRQANLQPRRMRSTPGPARDAYLKALVVRWYFTGKGLEPGDSFEATVAAGQDYLLQDRSRMAYFSFFHVPPRGQKIQVVFVAESDVNHGVIVRAYPKQASQSGQSVAPLLTYAYSAALKKAKLTDLAVADQVRFYRGQSAVSGQPLQPVDRALEAVIRPRSEGGAGQCWIMHEKTGIRYTIPVERMQQGALLGQKVLIRLERDVNRGLVSHVSLASAPHEPLVTYQRLNGVWQQVDRGLLDLRDAMRGRQDLQPVDGRMATFILDFNDRPDRQQYVARREDAFLVLPKEATSALKGLATPLDGGIGAVLRRHPVYGLYAELLPLGEVHRRWVAAFGARPLARYLYSGVSRKWAPVNFAKLAFLDILLGRDIGAEGWNEAVTYEHEGTVGVENKVTLAHLDRTATIRGLPPLAGQRVICAFAGGVAEQRLLHIHPAGAYRADPQRRPDLIMPLGRVDWVLSGHRMRKKPLRVFAVRRIAVPGLVRPIHLSGQFLEHVSPVLDRFPNHAAVRHALLEREAKGWFNDTHSLTTGEHPDLALWYAAKKFGLRLSRGTPAQREQRLLRRLRKFPEVRRFERQHNGHNGSTTLRELLDRISPASLYQPTLPSDGEGDGMLDALSQYLRNMRQFPRLTPLGEIVLGARSRLGDEAAREALTTSNLPLVVSIAKRYTGHGIPLLDLINEGNVALMEAARDFDPLKNRLSTLAFRRIEARLKRRVNEAAGDIHIPQNTRIAWRKFQRACLAAKIDPEDRQRDDDEIAEAIGWPVEEVTELRRVGSLRPTAWHASPSDEESGLAPEEWLGKEDSEPSLVDSEVGRAFFKRLEQAMLASGRWRNKEFVKRDVGIFITFLSNPESTLEEVGVRFGVTGEYARQVKGRVSKVARTLFTQPQELRALREGQEHLPNGRDAGGIAPSDFLDAPEEVRAPSGRRRFNPARDIKEPVDSELLDGVTRLIYTGETAFYGTRDVERKVASALRNLLTQLIGANRIVYADHLPGTFRAQRLTDGTFRILVHSRLKWLFEQQRSNPTVIAWLAAKLLHETAEILMESGPKVAWWKGQLDPETANTEAVAYQVETRFLSKVPEFLEGFLVLVRPDTKLLSFYKQALGNHDPAAVPTFVRLLGYSMKRYSKRRVEQLETHIASLAVPQGEGYARTLGWNLFGLEMRNGRSDGFGRNADSTEANHEAQEAMAYVGGSYNERHPVVQETLDYLRWKYPVQFGGESRQAGLEAKPAYLKGHATLVQHLTAIVQAGKVEWLKDQIKQMDAYVQSQPPLADEKAQVRRQGAFDNLLTYLRIVTER
ncbi:MAG: sigma-70 family RNA polymerase sigma factor, partial [Candidatus Omnitrophica bacterium]|nr:sigma-70 family RNA polymerase sigma factor [Candidatus Omnitrophota bacterium]